MGLLLYGASCIFSSVLLVEGREKCYIYRINFFFSIYKPPSLSHLSPFFIHTNLSHSIAPNQPKSPPPPPLRWPPPFFQETLSHNTTTPEAQAKCFQEFNMFARSHHMVVVDNWLSGPLPAIPVNVVSA